MPINTRRRQLPLLDVILQSRMLWGTSAQTITAPKILREFQTPIMENS